MQGACTEFLIEFSRTATNAVAAPQEQLNSPGTVYVIINMGKVAPGAGGPGLRQ